MCVCVCARVHICVCERKTGSERMETNLIVRIMQLQHACSAGALELFLSFLFLVNFCIANTNLYWRAYVRVCVQTEFTVGGRVESTNADSHIWSRVCYYLLWMDTNWHECVFLRLITMIHCPYSLRSASLQRAASECKVRSSVSLETSFPAADLLLFSFFF